MKRSRGQLILTAAILVGLTIVASAVLLNSIHASADIQSQDDRKTLEQTERTIEKVESDMEGLFLNNGSDGRYPFVQDANEFEAFVDEYTSQYLNVSTTTSNGFLDVTFFTSASASTRGSLFVQNDTRDFSGPGCCLNFPNGDGVPYLYFDVESINNGGSFTIRLYGSEDIEIEDTGGADTKVRLNGDLVCDVGEVTQNDRLEIELINEEGVVRYDGTVCGEFNIPLGPGNDVFIQGGNSAEGQFIITIRDPTPGGNYNTGPDRSRSTGGVVDPKFRVSYQDPQIQYEGNVTLYGGGP